MATELLTETTERVLPDEFVALLKSRSAPPMNQSDAQAISQPADELDGEAILGPRQKLCDLRVKKFKTEAAEFSVNFEFEKNWRGISRPRGTPPNSPQHPRAHAIPMPVAESLLMRSKVGQK